MKFKLEIDLGNDAMLDFQHIGQAVLNAGQRIVDEDSGGEVEPQSMFSIFDINGNKVGKCWVSE